MAADLRETNERLWVPVVAPAIWAIHFTLCYGAVVAWCGRFALRGSIAGLRTVVAACTVVAMAAMVGLLVQAWRRRHHGWPSQPHDDDTPEDRTHFIAWTTMLLAGLSLVATAFVALAVLLVDGCG